MMKGRHWKHAWIWYYNWKVNEMEAIIAIAAITLCIILRFWLGIILVLVILFMTGCSTVPVCPQGQEGYQCRVERHQECLFVGFPAWQCAELLGETKRDKEGVK